MESHFSPKWSSSPRDMPLKAIGIKQQAKPQELLAARMKNKQFEPNSRNGSA